MYMNKMKIYFISFIALLFMSLPECFGYRVMVSLNTYSKEKVQDAVARASELKADGAWIITQNSDFDDAEWRAILTAIGGEQFTEDNPDKNKSYLDYVRIMRREPDGSFCYNETGGQPGGTQLSDEAIEAQSATHGDKPIICLTRSYGGAWKTETDRCLANDKVMGMCLEYVKKALLENINAPAEGIRATLSHGKSVFVLLHTAEDGWTLEENRQIIENLNKWCPESMQSDDVYIVYQDYFGDTDAWFGPGGVKEAIDMACNMPNYTGGK